MKKFILKSCLFSVIFFGIGVFIISGFAALSQVTSGTPLTASTWNTMISNIFWGSGSGGIYYNGKVGIGATSPNRNLHIYDTTNNAEIDIQSVAGAGNHWGIYQDASSKQLRLWNQTDKILISTGGTLNAVGGICINGDCKTSWSQVAGGSSVGVYQFTGTSATCDSASAGKIKYSAGSFYGCDGTNWLQIVSNKKGSFTNPGLSCKDILNNGGSIGDGSYRIQPSGAGSSFQVYCDMTTSGGGRTLIAYGNQRPSSYNLSGLKNLAGSLSYTTSARTNFGTLPYALTITKASTQIAFSYDPTQNKTGNMNAYESYAIVTLPTPSSITLDFADPGTCVDVSFVTTKGRTFPNTYKRYSKSLGVISSTRYFFGFTNASRACANWTNGDEIMFDAGASLDNGWRYANTSYSADGSVGMWVK